MTKTTTLSISLCISLVDTQMKIACLDVCLSMCRIIDSSQFVLYFLGLWKEHRAESRVIFDENLEVSLMTILGSLAVIS